jgi:CRP-like cAMP-binding protein
MAYAALFAGVVSAISLPIGAAIGLVTRPGPKLTSALMAFGGGALLFALSIEIVAHSFHKVGFAPLAFGAVIGGVSFEILNRILNSQGGFLRKAATLVKHITLLKRKQADEVLSHLSKIQLVQELPPEEIAHLVPKVNARAVKKGEVICTVGEAGDAMYMVNSGGFIATLGEKVIHNFTGGDTFGEMALITGAPRTATITATEDGQVYVVSKRDFDEMMELTPATREKLGAMVVERSSDLVNREMVSVESAKKFKRSAADFVMDMDLKPTSKEIQQTASTHSAAAMGIWLGILLDGIPESVVIGTSVEGFGNISWALIAGVFMANLPEAMSSSVVMRAQKHSNIKILLMWGSIVVITGAGALLGNTFLREVSPWSFAIIEGAAAGAMLTMIAETMMPEAYERGGAIVGLSTLAGFLAALFVKSIA